MKVIGFCGLPGSGKSTAIEAISDLGIIVTMGDVVRNEAKRRNIKPIDTNLGKIAKELREKGGPEIIAENCVDLIKKLNNVFRKSWKFPIISIHINKDERFKRLSKRGRSDDPKATNDLMERDKREIEFGLKEVLEKADYKIINNSTITDLQKRVREVVKEIITNLNE